MWGSKSTPVSSPPSTAPPFFPDVGPKVGFHHFASVSIDRRTRGQGQGHRAIEEKLGIANNTSGTPYKEEAKETSAAAFARTRMSEAANGSNVYRLGASQSSVDLHSQSAYSQSATTTPQHRHTPQRALAHSQSTSSLPFSPTGASGDSAVVSYPYSGVAHGILAPPPPSNSSSKLASRVDRWQSVEDLLDHSQAVITAAGKSPGGAYDPTGFNTFSHGGAHTGAVATPSPKRTQPNHSRPSGPLSPFSTIAPPPAPAGPPSTWGGSVSHATPGLKAAIQVSSATHTHAANTANAIMTNVAKKLAKLDSNELTLTVTPSVLVAAGMTSSDSDRPSNELRSGGSAPTSVTPIKRKDPFASKSASERLFTHHKHMLREARANLPPALKSDTQGQIVSAVQGLKPRTLLDILSPQSHILSVTLSEFISQLRTSDREKSNLLSHLIEHMRLIQDTLLQFVQISCNTLEQHSEEQTQTMRELTKVIIENEKESENTSIADGGAAAAGVVFEPNSMIGELKNPPATLAERMRINKTTTTATRDERTHQRNQSEMDSIDDDDGNDDELVDDSFREDEYGTSSSSSRREFDLSRPLAPPSLDTFSVDDVVPSVSNVSPVVGNLHFGNSHAWELERWRQLTLARRQTELKEEQHFLTALGLVSELSQLRKKELELLGSERFRLNHRDDYSKVHGQHESLRLKLQTELDTIKTSIEPTYSVEYMRVHQKIVEVAEVQRRAAEEQAAAAATGGAVGDGIGPWSELALQISLMTQGDLSHSTNKSAHASAKPGGRSHRLPHSTWLSLSNPHSSKLLGTLDPIDLRKTSSGLTSSEHGVMSQLRRSRIHGLVTLENVLNDLHESHGDLLQHSRNLEQRLHLLETWKMEQLKMSDDTSNMYQHTLSKLESQLEVEHTSFQQVSKELQTIRLERFTKDGQRLKVEEELQQVKYQLEQVHQAYAKHVTNRVPTIDVTAQTDENLTAIRNGGWDKNGNVPLTNLNLPQTLTDEMVATLQAAGLYSAKDGPPPSAGSATSAGSNHGLARRPTIHGGTPSSVKKSSIGDRSAVSSPILGPGAGLRRAAGGVPGTPTLGSSPASISPGGVTPLANGAQLPRPASSRNISSASRRTQSMSALSIDGGTSAAAGGAAAGEKRRPSADAKHRRGASETADQLITLAELAEE